jgi:hypothetical protein
VGIFPSQLSIRKANHPNAAWPQLSVDSYQLSGLSVILKAEGIERHLKGSFRELRID